MPSATPVRNNPISYSLADRWRLFRPYVAALTIFLSSRVVIYLAIKFAKRFIPRADGPGLWDAGDKWYHSLLRWDSGWYHSILANGYSFNGDGHVQQNVNFFPLYPLVAKITSIALGVNGYAALLIVANASAILSVIALYKLVSSSFDEQIGLTTVALFSFFPASIFLSAGYSEPLTLLLMLCSLLLVNKQHYIAAAAVAGLAVATRATGMALLPVLLWELWRQQQIERRKLVFYVPLVIVLVTSGIWVHMIFLWKTLGYPLAFWSARVAWMSSGKAIGSGLLDLLTPAPLFSALKLENLKSVVPAELDAWFFALFALLIAISWRRLPFSLLLFGLGVLLIPYLALGGGQGFNGMSRYVFLAFPAFIGAASFTEGRPWLTASAIGLSSALLFAYSAMFAQWYWVA